MILFILCVTVVPVLAGLACMRLKREKETMTLTEAYMMGLLVLFLLNCFMLWILGSNQAILKYIILFQNCATLYSVDGAL